MNTFNYTLRTIGVHFFPYLEFGEKNGRLHFGGRYLKYFEGFFHKLNVTSVCDGEIYSDLNENNLGTPDADGNFNGAQGYYQRNELDFVPYLYDIGLINTEITVPSPVVADFNYHAYSEFEGGVKVSRTDILLGLPEIFDTWSRGLVVLCVMIIWLVELVFAKIVFKREFDLIWRTTALMLQFHHKLVEYVSENFLWFWMVVLCSFGFWLTSAGFSSNFIVPEFPFILNTFQDILDRGYEPICFSQFGTENALLYAANPVTRRIGQIVLDQGNCSVSVAGDVFETLRETTLKLHKKSTFLMGGRASSLVRKMICLTSATRIHMSDESSSNTMMAFTMRRNLPLLVKNEVNKNFRALLESGVVNYLVEAADFKELLSLTTQGSEVKKRDDHFRCMNEGRTFESDFVEVTMENMSGTISLALIFIAAAYISATLEYLIPLK